MSEIPELSEDLKHLIGKKPSWIFANGVSVLGIFMLIFLIASIFIRVPIKYKTTINISSMNPPLISKAADLGIIQQLFVKNHSLIKKGDKILMIKDGNASAEEIGLLKQAINSIINMRKHKEIQRASIPVVQNLGSLDPAYQEFSYKFRTYQDRLLLAETKLLGEDNLKYLKEKKKNWLTQYQILRKNQLMIEKEKDAHDKLSIEKVITDFEANQVRMKLNNTSQELEKIKEQLIEIDLQINEVRLSNNRYEREFYESDQGIFKYSKDLLAKILSWEEKFVKRAVVDGTIELSDLLVVNRQVEVGEILYTIIPQINESYSGKFEIPQRYFDKIRVGNQAIVELESYPPHEYGYLRGKVNYISNIDNVTFISYGYITFDSHNASNYSKRIRIKDNLKGKVDLIIKGESLLALILNITKFRSVNSDTVKKTVSHIRVDPNCQKGNLFGKLPSSKSATCNRT